MRIILLGYKGSGKSSSGNTILGSEQFNLERTDQSEKRQGYVAGRHVTVVNTPGWWSVDPLAKTSEETREEIAFSASLCPPGPHAVLLVLRPGIAYTADVYESIEQHMQLLGETVWNHTIILFPFGDRLELQGTSIEQYIERAHLYECHQGLLRLVQKCSYRYHIFYNVNIPLGYEALMVTELLDKIEEMVAGETGKCFEIDERLLETEMERSLRRTQHEGARPRRMRVKKERENIRSKMGDDHHLSEMRIILLGYKGSGKTSSGNTILGSKQFSLEETGLCVTRQGHVAGRHVTVVNSPGWFADASQNETSELLKEEIIRSASLCHPGPHALLLVITWHDSCPADVCKNAEEHMQLLGETVWSHTMILFRTQYVWRESVEQHIESEGEALQRLVEKCGNRYHAFITDTESEDYDYMQVPELLDKIEEMVAENGGHYGTGSPATPTPDKSSLSLDVKETEKSQKLSQEKEVEKLTVQMKEVKSELEKINLRQTEADMRHTSLVQDTQKNTKDFEDSTRRLCQLEQDQQELRDQFPVLVGQVKRLTARFEVEANQWHTMGGGQKRASATRQHRTQTIIGADDKLLSARKDFIQSISEPLLNELLDELLDKGVISGEELDTAMAEKIRQNKARHVIDTVRLKGKKASSIMIVTIQRLDRNLSEKLLLDPASLAD